MLDQLPVLSDVQRFLDELAIIQLPPNQVSSAGKLALEAVPIIRNTILKKYKNDYVQIANKFTKECEELKREDDLAHLAEIYNMDGIDDLLSSTNLTEDESMHQVAKQPTNIPLTLLEKPIHVRLSISNTLKKHKIYEIGSSDDEDQEIELTVDISTERNVTTDHGIYFRYTLKQNDSDKTYCIKSNASIEAVILFEGAKLRSTTLQCPNVDLPMPPYSQENLKNHAKVWRQVGSLECSNGVLQLQAKLTKASKSVDGNSYYFILGSTFLSVPA